MGSLHAGMAFAGIVLFCWLLPMMLWRTALVLFNGFDINRFKKGEGPNAEKPSGAIEEPLHGGAEPKEPAEPIHLKRLNNIYMNNFEVPVLFLFVVAVIEAQKLDNPRLTGFAWAFVVLRFLHGLVYLFWNNVLVRFSCFFGACLALMCLWGETVVHLATGS